MNRRVQVLAGVAAVAALVAVWPRAESGLDLAGSPAASRSRRAEATLPRIGLDRLGQARPEARAGQRDLFDFSRPPAAQAAPAPAATPRPAPPPGPAPASVPAEPTASTAAAVSAASANVRYIGRLDRAGLQVAILLTDRDEVLTGRVGQTLSNSFKIVSIGLESVDIQDVGSERVRRIPLKGK